MRASTAIDTKNPCLVLLVCLLSIGFSGCKKDDYKPVDFSKTISTSDALPDAKSEIPLRVAVAAMTSPRENFSSYRQLLDYLGEKLGKRIRLVQRKTYAEIDSLFTGGELDLAFICTGPYVKGVGRLDFEGLVAPVISGVPYYQAYLIVNRNSPYTSLNDLRGRTFAFTDPDSNTGAAVPRYWLSLLHETPESFFSEIVYTYSHDNSIKAVGRSLVDGASVDSAIWNYYNQQHPEYTSKTKIIQKSESFGSPPVVAAKGLPDELKDKIKQILKEMNTDPEGKKILASLAVDAFVEMKDSCYASTREMLETLEHLRNENHAK